MGRDLGRAALAGAVLVVALAGLVAALVAGTGTAMAWADPTPAPVPSPSVSPPSQQQIDDAKAALERLRNQGKSPDAELTQVAGPAATAGRDGVTSRISDRAWWTLGAGLLLLLVASETTRLRVRRAKHRKGA